jgi:hypothetical protein
MNRLSERCARILKVRSVEHRVAACEMVAAEKRIGDLLGVVRRIGDLRTSLRPGPGATSGQALSAMAEMAARLERAEGDLVHPIRQASHHLDQATAARLIARSREDGIGRLRESALAREESAATLRADANRPFRSGKRRPA